MGEVLEHRDDANYFPGCSKARKQQSKAACKNMTRVATPPFTVVDATLFF